MNTYEIFYKWCGVKYRKKTCAENIYDAELSIINLLEIDKIKLIRGIEPSEKTKINVDDLMSSLGMK